MDQYVSIRTAERVVTAANWGGDDAVTVVTQLWVNAYPLRGDESLRSLREVGISGWNVECHYYDIADPSVTVSRNMRVYLDDGDTSLTSGISILEIEDIQHLDMAKDRAVLRCKEIR